MFTPKTAEDYRFVKYANRLIRIFTGMDQMVYHGLENVVMEGPNIITPNHPDIGKGIAAMAELYLKEADRRVDFIARKEIFSREGFKEMVEAHYKTSIGRRMFQLALKPLEFFLTNYIPPAMNDTGMIPLDIRNGNNIQSMKYNLKVISEIIEPKLLAGKAIVLLQYNKNKTSSPNHHYLQKFHQTPAKIAFNTYAHRGLLVPVTPISVHGGEGILPLARVVVNVGAPLYITDFLEDDNPIKSMTDALEKRTATLLEESGLRDDPEKHKIDRYYMSKTISTI